MTVTFLELPITETEAYKGVPFQTSHFFLVISQEWHLCISSVNLCYSKGD